MAQKPVSGTQKRTRRMPVESFVSVLHRLVGETVTVVNPEAFEEGLTHAHLTTNIYRAKVLGVEGDVLVMSFQFEHRPSGKMPPEKETATQFVPINKVKRVTVMKSRRLVHI